MRTGQEVTISVVVDGEGPITDAELDSMARQASNVLEGYNRVRSVSVSQREVRTDL